MAAPRVSVAMATYNQARFVREALDSVLAQTLPAHAFEVIIVDDGSTDDTSRLLDPYASRCRVLHRSHRGLVPAINDALATASGHWFARLDSDDAVAVDWLARLLTAADAHPNAAVVYPDLCEVRGEARTHVPVNADDLFTLQACGSLLRTDLVRQAGGYRPYYWEEHDLHLRLKSLGPFVHVAEPLYFYRRHEANLTAKKESRIRGWRELAHVWGLGALRAAGTSPDLDAAAAILQSQTYREAP